MTFSERVKSFFIRNPQPLSIESKSLQIQQGVNINDDIYFNDETGMSIGSVSHSQLSKQYKNLAYSCINLRGQSAAMCEPFVLKESNQSDSIELDKHPLADIFNNPNPRQTYYDLVFDTVKNLDLYGDCFWYVVKDNFGDPVEFWILPTSCMKIVVKNGIVVGYQYKTQNKAIDYQLDEVIHFQYPSADKAPYGMGIIEAGAVIFDIENAINRYQKRYFDNDAQPRFVLTTENKLSEVEFKRFIEGFNKSYRGSNNSNKAMILSQGFTPKLLSTTPKEADFVDTWKIIQTRTLSLFGVHPALVGIIEDVNRANAIEAQTIFTDRTIAPIVKRIDNTITKFARNTWGDLSLKVVHKIESPSDRVQQLNEMQVALANGAISINEFREWLGKYDSVKNGDETGNKKYENLVMNTYNSPK